MKLIDRKLMIDSPNHSGFNYSNVSYAVCRLQEPYLDDGLMDVVWLGVNLIGSLRILCEV